MAYTIDSPAYKTALLSMFAAIHFTMTMVPAAPAIGTGGFLSLGMVSAPMAGFLLGPVIGTIAVLLGSYIAMFANAELMVLGLFTPIATAAGALAAGFIRIRKPSGLLVTYVISIGLYIASPIGIMGIGFLWFHMIGLFFAILISFPMISKRFLDFLNFDTAKILIRRIEKPKKIYLLFPLLLILGGLTLFYLPGLSIIGLILSIVGILVLVIIGMFFVNLGAENVVAFWLLAFLAIMVDQVLGSAIGVYYLTYFFGLDTNTIWGWWSAVMFLYPIERVLGSFFSAAVIIAIGRIVLNEFPLPSMPFTSKDPKDRIMELEEE